MTKKEYIEKQRNAIAVTNEIAEFFKDDEIKVNAIRFAQQTMSAFLRIHCYNDLSIDAVLENDKKQQKYRHGDKVLVEFFNPLNGMKSVGKKECLVESYMENLTKIKNDGQEYYKIFIDCDKEKPFFSSSNNMELIK